MDIKLRSGQGYRYLAVYNYALSNTFVTIDNKEHAKQYLQLEREKIDLALEQLKDIEKMSEEL